MKRLFLLFCLLPSLLLCGCISVPAADSQATEPDPLFRPDLEEYLGGIATEVVTAFAYGRFEDVEHYMLYSFDRQLEMLFPGQSAPYEYEGHTFDSKEALADAVRSHLISGDNPDFAITVTGTTILLYPGDYQYGFFGFDDDPIELDHFGNHIDDLRMPASIVVSFTIEGGEGSTGSMYVDFLLVGDEWKVFSPTVCGYFLQLHTPKDL